LQKTQGWGTRLSLWETKNGACKRWAARPSIAAIALQSDGKIVAVGSDGSGTFIVARYLGQ